MHRRKKGFFYTSDLHGPCLNHSTSRRVSPAPAHIKWLFGSVNESWIYCRTKPQCQTITSGQRPACESSVLHDPLVPTSLAQCCEAICRYHRPIPGGRQWCVPQVYMLDDHCSLGSSPWGDHHKQDPADLRQHTQFTGTFSRIRNETEVERLKKKCNLSLHSR